MHPHGSRGKLSVSRLSRSSLRTSLLIADQDTMIDKACVPEGKLRLAIADSETSRSDAAPAAHVPSPTLSDLFAVSQG